MNIRNQGPTKRSQYLYHSLKVSYYNGEYALRFETRTGYGKARGRSIREMIRDFIETHGKSDIGKMGAILMMELGDSFVVTEEDEQASSVHEVREGSEPEPIEELHEDHGFGD